MPRGSRHILTGTLCWTQRGYALRMDDGGQWRLDTMRPVRRYIDQRVTIEGIRSGFDLLDVHRIALGESLPPKQTASWRAMLAQLIPIK